MGLMILLTVPAVLVWTKLTSLQLEDMITRTNSLTTGDRASFFYYAFHGYAFSQPIVAVALWIGLVMLGLFREERAPEPVPARTLRNAGCPCGSGRKYKRCCGAARLS